MKKRDQLCIGITLALTCTAAFAATPDPFASNDCSIPPKSSYDGSLFSLSHDYPDKLVALPPVLPWRAAIGNGRITTVNAGAYVRALKQHVSADMRVLFQTYPKWNAAERGWYNEPWLGPERESIHGMYVGSGDFPAELFKGSGLAADFSTYVLTYYDRRAAHTLHKVWGKAALNPAVTTGNGQIAEGGVVVKAAFTTANADKWPVMQGALQWPIYATVNATLNPNGKNEPGGRNEVPLQLMQTSLMQFDLIVKDSRSAPKSGWVFATLVYDASAPGKDVWDKMVPLGVMWGNDPDIDSARTPNARLRENWINPKAPAYAKMTLGWGGRLSGPNDGALNDAAFVVDGKGQRVKNAASSSCMSCHGPAEWPRKSFLLPTVDVSPTPVDGFLPMWKPGSKEWMRWFQSRPGNVPQDPGTAALDYDMVMSFKSLPAWLAAMAGGAGSEPCKAVTKPVRTLYNGRVAP